MQRHGKRFAIGVVIQPKAETGAEGFDENRHIRDSLGGFRNAWRKVIVDHRLHEVTGISTDTIPQHVIFEIGEADPGIVACRLDVATDHHLCKRLLGHEGDEIG